MPLHHKLVRTKQVYSRPEPQGVASSGSTLGGEWTTYGTTLEAPTGGLGGSTQIQKAVDLREYQEGWKSVDHEAYNSGASMEANKGVFNYIGKVFYGAKAMNSLPIAQLKADLVKQIPGKKDLDHEINITLITMNQQGLVDLS